MPTILAPLLLKERKTPALMEELPPGFRFYPTEEELISFYLHHKLNHPRPELDRVISMVDIYSHEPDQLPNLAGEWCRGDSEQWFFFMPRQERELRGGRPNRTTATGYWKATGSPGYVFSSTNKVIGVKKTMVFYNGKAPTGRKTKWKMNEYKAINEGESSSHSTTIPKLRHELSLCRVYITSGFSRAFDRRPAANMITTSNQREGEGPAPTITQAHADSSCSGGDEHVEPPADAAGSSTSYDQGADDLEPLWDWEQLNWL